MTCYRIYKIINLDDGKCYIGSTVKTLKERIRKHIISSNGGYNKCSCKYFNWDNIEVEELEKSINMENRFKSERYFIENTENCININIPYKTQEERIEERKQRSHDKYKNHRKPYMLEKVECECGDVICRASFNRHISSLLHLGNLLKM